MIPRNAYQGRTIGDYYLEDELGRGGMGVVYRARRRSDGSQVAVKFLPPSSTKTRGATQQFIKEAQAASKFHHPNIVRTHGVERAEDTYCIVMEYVEGETLSTRIKRLGRLSVTETLRIALEIAQALSFLHSRGIIHRDVKPHNIIIDQTGRARLMDFGVVKTTWDFELAAQDDWDQANPMLTLRAGVGTPHYMSPEQIRGNPIDGRTDVYSLGATMCHMLIGRPPFEGKKKSDLIAQVLQYGPPYIRDENNAAPVALADLVSSMLAINPALRPRTCGVVASRIQEIQRSTRFIGRWFDRAGDLLSGVVFHLSNPRRALASNGTGRWLVGLLVLVLALLILIRLLVQMGSAFISPN